MRQPSPFRVAAIYLSSWHMAIRVADAFTDSVKSKKFRNPDTGNQVTFGSLPDSEQKKLRSKWQETQEAEDLTEEAELEEDDGTDGKTDKPEKQSWKDHLKGHLKALGKEAKAFLSKAPEKVQQFVADPAFRKKTLGDAAMALSRAPAKIVGRLINAAKEEVKEYKEAGDGVAAVLRGGKMNDHQKKAFKTVATHVAIGVAVAALSASGPLAAAGIFGKGIAKHVAMKAVTKCMSHIHLFQEVTHIGHEVTGLLSHIAGEDKKPDIDDLMGKYIAAMVAKEIQGLTDEDVTKALKGLDEEDSED